MGHKYNLRSSKQMMEPEVPLSPSPPATTVDASDNGGVMESGPQSRALRNKYILKELFSHLPVEDLKKCRLVNQVWNQVATRVLAPKAPVVEFTFPRGMKRMELFLDTFSNTENPPYRKFLVRSNFVGNASPEKQLVLPKFIEKVAPTVSHLGVYSGCHRLFPWKKPKKGTEYIKLKSVEFQIFPTIYGAQSYAQMKANADFMINILQHSPNLDNITVLSAGHECADRWIEKVPWTKIRHLKLDGELEDGHFQKIIELGTAMKLNSFEMVARRILDQRRARVRPINGTTFPKFLDQQNGSLEALKMQFNSWLPEPHRDFRLPRLPKLKTLEVNFFDFYAYTGNEMYGLLSLSSFSQTFPALNSVTVTGIWWSELTGFLRSEDSVPVETVNALKFDLSGDFLRTNYANMKQPNIQQVIRHQAQMFPNIRILDSPADVGITRAIVVEPAWQNLKYLMLLSGKARNVDSSLIGQDSKESMRISKLKPESQEFREAEREIESKIFEFLQNLEILQLDLTDVYERATNFSNLSCRLVLLKLRNLKLLNLCGLGDLGFTYEVTLPMIEEMSVKFKVLYKDGKLEEVQ